MASPLLPHHQPAKAPSQAKVRSTTHLCR